MLKVFQIFWDWLLFRLGQKKRDVLLATEAKGRSKVLKAARGKRA